MTSRTWVVVFSRDSQNFGGRFKIDTSRDENIGNLKITVKNFRENDLSHIDPPELTIWRCKDRETYFHGGDTKALDHQINELLSREELELLAEDDNLMDLCILVNETLLVEAPSKSLGSSIGNHIKSKMDQEFEACYLQVHTKGKVTSEDINVNYILDANESNVPKFVKEHEKILSQKRKVSDEMRAAAKYWVGEVASMEYFDYSMESTENPQSISAINQIERNHLGLVSNVNEAELWNKEKIGNGRLFNIDDANWLFFYPFAHHLESASSNVTVKLGRASWPFRLVMQVEQDHYMYEPQSDFLVLKFNLPRLGVAVAVNPPDSISDMSHHRLILQGASIVRFANSSLKAYKEEKNFIFMAVFVCDAGQADRYLLYQSKGSDAVYRSRKFFKFANQRDRVKFMLELYNFASTLQEESENEDTRQKVRKFAESVDRLRLPMFPSKANLKRLPSDNNGENRSGHSVHRKSSDGEAIEELELCGYKVVPDVFETDGGTWELLDKLPPHLRTVYRRSDPNKTEFIAKHVREGSNEPDILKYLHTKRPLSPHVMIEGTLSITREWLILPKLYPIRHQRFMDSCGVSGRVQLGWGLIKGLAYLHKNKIAHRDIKPDNLVCDDDFCLQIIDFDAAIQVLNENTQIDEYRGTKGWTAPEMGTEDGPTPMYSPIKADRWSCGRVLLYHIIVGKGDNNLQKFAQKLMTNDPQQRPSLLVQHKSLDGGSMKLPDAKKPRFK